MVSGVEVGEWRVRGMRQLALAREWREETECDGDGDGDLKYGTDDDDEKDGEAVTVVGERAGATVIVQMEETASDVPRGRRESGGDGHGSDGG